MSSAEFIANLSLARLNISPPSIAQRELCHRFDTGINGEKSASRRWCCMRAMLSGNQAIVTTTAAGLLSRRLAENQFVSDYTSRGGSCADSLTSATVLNEVVLTTLLTKERKDCWLVRVNST